MFNYSAVGERRSRRSYHRLPTSRNSVIRLRSFNKSCKTNTDRLILFPWVTLPWMTISLNSLTTTWVANSPPKMICSYVILFRPCAFIRLRFRMIGSSSSVVNGPPGSSPFSSEQSFSIYENLVSTRHRNASSNESWSEREYIFS